MNVDSNKLNFHDDEDYGDAQYRRLMVKPSLATLPIDKLMEVCELLKIKGDEIEKFRIRILDEKKEDYLILIHYLIYDDSVAHTRGMILYIPPEGEIKIVAGSFPYIHDIPVSDVKPGTINITPETTITKAYEGTLLRMFKGPVTGKWYLSTHKKIDGRNSKWVIGPSFGKIFDGKWGEENYDDYLSPDECYIFLASHPEYKLVCNIVEDVKLVGKCVRSGCNMVLEDIDKTLLKKEHPSIKVEGRFHKTFASTEEFLDCITNEINIKECAGLLISTPRDINSFKRIVSDEYVKKREIRGNEPNLRLRYIQFLKEKNTELIRDLFPEKNKDFDEVEEDMLLIPPYIAKLYRERMVKFVTLPTEEHILLEKIRKQYNKSKTLNENILLHLDSLTSRQINSIIRHIKQEAKK